MPDLDGIEVLRALKAVQPELIVIMMSSFGSIDTAIEAMKEGAYDEMTLTIQRALERRQLVADNQRFQQELQDKHRIDRMVGSSTPMLEVYKLVARAAPTVVRSLGLFGRLRLAGQRPGA